MRTSKILCCLLLSCALAGFAVPAAAVATITIVNTDGAGEGFNDPTPVTPAGGNPAHTLGGARLLAFQHAAFLWGSKLNSSVEILVDAQFNPLPGGPTSAVLGSCGATSVYGNFPGAPVANTWYPSALADSLAGSDLSGTGAPDIVAQFNSDIDGNIVLGTIHWYYGLDGNPPGNDIDFLSVVLHELAHGLGFQTYYNLQTGAKLSGYDDTYLLNLVCPTMTPSRLSQMNNTQRVSASIADPQLRWDGANVAAAAAAIPLTSGWFPPNQVQMYAPNPLQLGSSVSHFHSVVFPNQLMEPAYTGVNHDLGLALDLMADVGWSLNTTGGTDVVFILDITGSTGALTPGWVAQIPAICSAWLAFDPSSRFAVASHVDFPFAPYGVAGEWGYRVEAAFTSSVATVQAALAALTQKYGYDSPESQYEAIYQVLTGVGRDLDGNLSYTDPGEYPPTPLGQLNPMVIYHFTYPQSFHDRDTEPNYPYAGSTAVAGQTLTQATLAAQASAGMFFGLTFINTKTVYDEKGKAVVPRATSGPLVDLADITGGLVFSVGPTDLSLLQDAIEESILHWAGSRQMGDEDQDGTTNTKDNCPHIFNEDQLDSDRDGVGDRCDNCVKVYNPDQLDRNCNGIGDVCDDCEDGGCCNADGCTGEEDPSDVEPGDVVPGEEACEGEECGKGGSRAGIS